MIGLLGWGYMRYGGARTQQDAIQYKCAVLRFWELGEIGSYLMESADSMQQKAVISGEVQYWVEGVSRFGFDGARKRKQWVFVLEKAVGRLRITQDKYGWMKFDRASRWQRVISAKYNVKVSICCSIFKSMLTAKYNLRIYLGYSMLSHIWKMNGEGLRYLCVLTGLSDLKFDRWGDWAGIRQRKGVVQCTFGSRLDNFGLDWWVIQTTDGWF